MTFVLNAAFSAESPLTASGSFPAARKAKALALSRSGHYLISGEAGGMITIWTAATGSALRTFRGHSESVSGGALSQAEDMFASSSHDGTVKVWSFPEGKLIRTLKGHTDRVNSVNFSPTGAWLVSASDDRTVRLWRLSDGAQKTLRGHTGAVYAAAFSPSGDVIASTGEDSTVRLWKAGDGAPLRKMRAGLLSLQYALAFSPSGQHVISGGEDGDIRYWRIVDGGLSKTLRSGGPVQALAFAPAGGFLVSGGRAGDVRVWREDGELAGLAQGQAAVTGLVASSDGTLIASSASDKTIKVWPLPSAEQGALGSARAPATPADTADQMAIDVELNELPEYQTSRTNAYAVIIGIERYRDLMSAEYAARDAALVKKYFEKALGIPADHILLRENERATLGDLQSAFESWLKNNVKPGAEVFVYYSGHGTPGTHDGASYLVPYDALPETIRTNGYPLQRLYETLGALPIQRALVILDACFSGAGGPRTVLARGIRPITPTVDDPILASGKIAVIAAAAGNQISGVHGGARLGLLTYHMIKGLRGEADSHKEKKISLLGLYSYLLPKVIVDARDSHREQEPKLLPSVTTADPWNGQNLAVLK